MKRVLVLFLLLILIVGCSNDDEINEVKKVYDGYIQNILNDNGKTAVQFLDTKTIDYYDKMLNHIISSERARVKTLNIIDKITVLLARHIIPKDTLLNFTAIEYIRYSVDNGMVGKNGVMDNTIGNITINKNFARGQNIQHGKKTKMFYHFYKEKGDWKINLTSILTNTVSELERMQTNSGFTESEFIFNIIKNVSGEAASEDVWNTLK